MTRPFLFAAVSSVLACAGLTGSAAAGSFDLHPAAAGPATRAPAIGGEFRLLQAQQGGATNVSFAAPRPHWYLRGQISYVASDEETIEGVTPAAVNVASPTGATNFDLEFDISSAIGAGLAFGRDFATIGRFRPRAEVEYTYHNFSVNNAIITFAQDGDLFFQPVPGGGGGGLTLHNLTLNGTIGYEVRDGIRPYLGLGAGFSYLSASAGGGSDESISYVGQGLVGLLLEVHREWAIDLNVRYTYNPHQVFDGDIDLNNLILTAGLVVRL